MDNEVLEHARDVVGGLDLPPGYRPLLLAALQVPPGLVGPAVMMLRGLCLPGPGADEDEQGEPPIPELPAPLAHEPSLSSREYLRVGIRRVLVACGSSLTCSVLLVHVSAADDGSTSAERREDAMEEAMGPCGVEEGAQDDGRVDEEVPDGSSQVTPDQIMATAASEVDMELVESGGVAVPAVVAEMTEEGRREAALALQASVEGSVVCEPGRLCFRAIISIPDPSGPQTEGRYRKQTTEWVMDRRGYEWRLMYFPQGNNAGRRNAVSLYLEIKPENQV